MNRHTKPPTTPGRRSAKRRQPSRTRSLCGLQCTRDVVTGRLNQPYFPLQREGSIMENLFDEFSKSLAEEKVPRRETLRRLGAGFATAILGSLGLGTAEAAKNATGGANSCNVYCSKRCYRPAKDQCIAACNACKGDTSRLTGTCGSFACCPTTLCSGSCVDRATDFYNCGACGNVCDDAGPNQYGACVSGSCEYHCVGGATLCGTVCTFLDSDINNCGACGNVCHESTPYCISGTCSACPAGLVHCGDSCVDIAQDPDNCGGCGVQCAANETCAQGVCGACDPGWTWCGGYCADLLSDQNNCGLCGSYCDPGYGVCQDGYCYYSGGGGGGGCH